MSPAVWAAVLMAITGTGAWLVAGVLQRHGARLGFTDTPNARSLHTRVTPRAGGAGFALTVPLATGVWMAAADRASPPVLVLLAAAAALAAVGLADDRRGLPPLVRLAAQAAAALAVVGSGAVIREVSIPGGAPQPLGGLAGPFTVLWLVSVTNIYNFMDGIDGLAGTQAVLAASAIAILAERAGQAHLAAALGILAAGVLGFLVRNWPPARIFMGDAGSTFLGFLFAGWAVVSGGGPAAPIPLFGWAAVLSPFLFDGTFTLLRRLLRGEPLHRPHRSHLYQQLVQRGWSHRQTTLLYGAIALNAGAWTVAFYGGGPVPAGAYLPALLLPLVLLPILTGAAVRPRT